MNNLFIPNKTIPKYLSRAPNTFYERYWRKKCDLQTELKRNNNTFAEILLEMRRHKLISKDAYAMIKMRFFENCTWEKVGKYFNVSRERVRQIEEWVLYRVNEYHDTGKCEPNKVNY
jgi:DNA-directed RNA polymerase sigma subunit (sigma70/sigma32)